MSGCEKRTGPCLEGALAPAVPLAWNARRLTRGCSGRLRLLVSGGTVGRWQEPMAQPEARNPPLSFRLCAWTGGGGAQICFRNAASETVIFLRFAFEPWSGNVSCPASHRTMGSGLIGHRGQSPRHLSSERRASEPGGNAGTACSGRHGARGERKMSIHGFVLPPRITLEEMRNRAAPQGGAKRKALAEPDKQTNKGDLQPAKPPRRHLLRANPT